MYTIKKVGQSYQINTPNEQVFMGSEERVKSIAEALGLEDLDIAFDEMREYSSCIADFGLNRSFICLTDERRVVL